jgi:DNA (cytosine-5)-methyltransferase 1
MHNVLDLFSGIGGFSLGLERTGGFKTSAFCEICPKARKVLRKHWADVPIYEDITKLTAEELHYDGIKIDCITGGFPCTDISCAGKGAGILAERSGLWSEMFRLIEDVRPQWAIIENVSALRSKGLTLVLQNLCSIGYMCEWHCIPASAVGAPHRRDRIWIIARPFKNSKLGKSWQEYKQSKKIIPNAESAGASKDNGGIRAGVSGTNRGEDAATKVSNADSKYGRGKQGYEDGEQLFLSGEQTGRTLGSEITRRSALLRAAEHWQAESNVGRVAHGVPNRVDRIKQLGNSLVPQIPELIGNAILEVER